MTLQDCLNQLTPLFEQLPPFMFVSCMLIGKDAEGGYGWHREILVRITEVDKVCRKCGYSQIYGGNDDAHPYTNHKWETREETAFIEGSVDFGYERIVNDVKDFVEQTKQRQ